MEHKVVYISKTENKPAKFALCTKCIICGEGTKLTEVEESLLQYVNTFYKVCDKCKQAVLYMREKMQ